jgi:DNA-binding transcriptional ArsR family regulator
VLRVHFTGKDLLRTRFASTPAPLIELTAAFAALRRSEPVFDNWRRHNSRRLPPVARYLFQLVPPTATSPLFLDPVSDSLADGLDTVLSTPHHIAGRELRRRACAGCVSITQWTQGLGDGDPAAWQLLANAIQAGHQTLIAPSWQRIQRGCHADIAWRSRVLAEFGLHAALTTLHPTGHWRGMTLEFDVDAAFAVRPNGQGVTLLPSMLWTGRPLIGRHPDGSVLIVYPAMTPLPLLDERNGTDPLAALLGANRAAVLTLAANPRSTTQLATELGISAASVSAHTHTLRTAGLLATERVGKMALHSLTPLGDRLLTTGGRRPDVNGHAPQPTRTPGSGETHRVHP